MNTEPNPKAPDSVHVHVAFCDAAVGCDIELPALRYVTFYMAEAFFKKLMGLIARHPKSQADGYEGPPPEQECLSPEDLIFFRDVLANFTAALNTHLANHEGKATDYTAVALLVAKGPMDGRYLMARSDSRPTYDEFMEGIMAARPVTGFGLYSNPDFERQFGHLLNQSH